MGRIKLFGLVFGIVAVAVLSGIGISIFVWSQRNVPDAYDNIAIQFKYGSFGGEANMLPYWVWRVLPDVFPDLMPEGPGEGYERFGFLTDADEPTDHPRPIGISYREAPIAQMGFTCAAYHSGTLRESVDSQPRIIIGMPAHQINIWDFTVFLFATANHEDFDADNIIPAIEAVNPDFSWLDRLLYRYIVIPRTKSGLLEREAKMAPVMRRDQWGFGRVDTFATHKYILFNLPDDTSGPVDFPSV